VDGRFLQADDVEGLRAQAVRAQVGGAGIVLVSAGPSGDPIVLAAGFTAPFDERLLEAIGLCRHMWREGRADSEGPYFPVRSAVNRPRPPAGESPLVALDLTHGDDAPPAFLGGAVDLLVRRTDDPLVCAVEAG
jgi:hypothetical protein